MRLRHFALALTALSLSATGARANPAHLWSQRWVHPDNQSFERVVVDASGNILVCGDFTSSLNLGSVYPSTGFQDVFVAKFSPAGSLVWMRTLGDVRPDRAMDLAVDLTGNVIFAGHLSSTMNDADAVVVKYAPDGTQRWFKRFGAGDLHFQSAECVSVNLSKEIIIAGEFDGPFSLGGPTLQPTGGITFFMAKLDQNGNHLWSKRFTTSTPYSYNLHGLETGADGETTFCGTLIDSLNLGNGVLKTAGQDDMFLARFDAGGNVLWSRSYGDSLAQEPTDIAVDAAGQIALAGFTNGAVCLGGDTLRAATDFDPFVAVLNSSGGHVWSRIFTGSSNQYPASLAWAGNQDLVVAFRGTGLLSFGGAALPIVGPQSGLWLAQFFGNTGVHRWSTTITSNTSIDGQIKEDDGKLILAGGVAGTIDFGGGQTTGEADHDDLYLAKFDDVLTAVASRRFFGELGQNIPNPFNPTTSIPYTLRTDARVRIHVYSITGALVSILDAGVQTPGPHTITWNGRDARGQSVASGVYFYRLEGSADAPRKMVLLK